MSYFTVSSLPVAQDSAVLWSAHGRLVDPDWRGWGKVAVWADQDGVHGPAADRVGEELWFRWAEVRDIQMRRVRHGVWVRRFAVVFVFVDEMREDVELMVSSQHWWGFYSPIVAVETAAWLRECRFTGISR